MTTLLLLFLLAQISPTVEATPVAYSLDDYHFEVAVEDFVMDALPRPLYYADHVPPAVSKQLRLLSDDCWRCRDRARDELIAMGPGVRRWLMWGLRGKHSQMRALSEQALFRVLQCRTCRGLGYCERFTPKDDGTIWCKACGYGRYSHEFDYGRDCQDCQGFGVCGR